MDVGAGAGIASEVSVVSSIARGGSGLDSVGYSFGGASVRWLARGNGTAGSLFLTGLEWTLTRDASGEDEDDNFVSGLAPVLGVEYRL